MRPWRLLALLATLGTIQHLRMVPWGDTTPGSDRAPKEVTPSNGTVGDKVLIQANGLPTPEEENEVTKTLNRIFNSLQAIQTSQENFKKSIGRINDSKVIDFLTDSHFMGRKIYQLFQSNGKEDMVSDDKRSESDQIERRRGRKVGTIIYNRINKSGSTSLLSELVLLPSPKLSSPSERTGGDQWLPGGRPGTVTAQVRIRWSGESQVGTRWPGSQVPAALPEGVHGGPAVPQTEAAVHPPPLLH